ncbi:copia protein [Tanacetum coccineum]
MDAIRAERLTRTHDPLALMSNSQNPYNYPVFHPDQPSLFTYMQQPQPNNNYIPQLSFNTNYMQQPMPNPKYITNPTTTMNMELVLMAKEFKLNYSTPTNNNQRTSSNPGNMQIAQPVQNVRNQARGNGNGNNGNQTQLLIAQKEEARIQLQAKEFDLMVAAGDINEIEEVNGNCILMANLQQASTSGTQTNKGIAISELKKLIEKMKRKYVETKFEKSLVILQPNAFKSQRQSVLGKPTIFLDSLDKKDFSKSKSITKNNVSNDFSKPVTAQILPQNIKSILKNTNVIAPGMYKVHIELNQTRTPQLPQDIRKTNKRVSFSTGVVPTTSVSRPQLKSNRMRDRVLPNNSQGKKQEVEDHHRNFEFSNNKISVTACNDSLNAKTSNVNFVCVTCGKCVLTDNHDLCVLHYIDGINSRTRQPIAVPISTREPKQTMNQSVATSHKKTVSTDFTVKKPRNIIRKIYEQLVEIILFIVDSGCSKHMTGNLKLLTNFVKKFLGTVKFGNDQIPPILGYGDLVQGTITIKRNNIVTGLLKLKFIKDHLCSSCELGKAKRKSFHTKTTPSSKRRLKLLHMDLCGPMRVESINAKKYVLVIVDDYPRYTWTHFLRSKDETPAVLIDFLTLVQRGLHAQVRTVRTDKGTEFVNKTLLAYFAKEGIRHETSTARTPEQNGVVERWNHTLVEAARTMLSDAKVPLFFWAEAIATTCFTQNRSLIIPRHEKTPYYIINGYSTQSRIYRVFNKRTRIIVETIHVNFDELPQMASDHVSSDPVPQCLTTVLEQDSLSPEPQSQENVPQAAETVTTSNEMDFLFTPMFDELLNETTPVVSKSSTVHVADDPNKRQHHNTTHSSTTAVVAYAPPLNIQTTPQTTNQAPTQEPTIVGPWFRI